MRSGKWTVTERDLVAAKVGALAAANVQRITGPMVADAVPARSLAAINAFLRQHYGGRYGLPKRDHKRKRMEGTEKESAAVAAPAPETAGVLLQQVHQLQQQLQQLQQLLRQPQPQPQPQQQQQQQQQSGARQGGAADGEEGPGQGLDEEVDDVLAELAAAVQ